MVGQHREDQPARRFARDRKVFARAVIFPYPRQTRSYRSVIPSRGRRRGTSHLVRRHQTCVSRCKLGGPSRSLGMTRDDLDIYRAKISTPATYVRTTSNSGDCTTKSASFPMAI